MRKSIQPTYDSKVVGPAYHVTYEVNGKVIRFQEPIADPFVRGRVTLGWRDLLKCLFRGRLVVEMVVGGHQDRLNDVLELDAQTLLPQSSRHQDFHAQVQRKLESYVSPS